MTLSEVLNKLTEEFRVGKQIFFSGNFVQMLNHSFSASCVVLPPLPKLIYENSLGVIGRLCFLLNKFNRGTFWILEAIHYNSKKNGCFSSGQCRMPRNVSKKPLQSVFIIGRIW